MTKPEIPTVGCPTCNGPLTPDGDGRGWECEVGHRFTPGQLTESQTTAVVRTLWYALRALEDRAIANKFLASDLEQSKQDRRAEHLREQNGLDLAMVDQLHNLLQEIEGRPGALVESGISHHESAGAGSHS